ncbi:MAG: carbohydrate kinase family protein [bacterium]|nr:carbohydrate kinase family protein [bacterium]
MGISNGLKQKYDVITIGGATYDITFFPIKSEMFLIDNEKDILRQKLLAFEHGAKISSEKVVHGFGGGAANTAVSFASFGFKSSAIIATGDDLFGNEIISNFKKKKVGIELIQKTAKQKSDFAVIIIGPDKDRIIFRDDNVKNKLELNRKGIAALKNTKWIYLASLSGDWQRILAQVFAVKNKKRKLRIAWNPGLSQLVGGLKELSFFFKYTEVLILNQDEATQLVTSDPKVKKENIVPSDVKNLLSIIKNYGPRTVVITCGRDGAWAYDGVKMYYAPIIEKGERLDTTGVGDAFGSSFVAGLELFKDDIDKAMKLGILNTSSVVAAPGAQNGLLGKKDLKNLDI